MEVLPVLMLIAINIFVVHHFDIPAILYSYCISIERPERCELSWILIFGYGHRSCLGIVAAYI